MSYSFPFCINRYKTGIFSGLPVYGQCGSKGLSLVSITSPPLQSGQNLLYGLITVEPLVALWVAEESSAIALELALAAVTASVPEVLGLGAGEAGSATGVISGGGGRGAVGGCGTDSVGAFLAILTPSCTDADEHVAKEEEDEQEWGREGEEAAATGGGWRMRVPSAK